MLIALLNPPSPTARRKRYFSPAQRAAQRLFAQRAKTGRLRRRSGTARRPRMNVAANDTLQEVLTMPGLALNRRRVRRRRLVRRRPARRRRTARRRTVRRRRVRRNVWREPRTRRRVVRYAPAHSRAARKGWRARRRPARRRRRRVRRNPTGLFGMEYAMNVRPRRRRRRYRRNPFGISIAPIREVFSLEMLKDGLQIVGGGLATQAVTNQALTLLGKPEWSLGWYGYVTKLLGTGIVGMISAAFGRRRLARNLMLGGVALVVGQALHEQVLARIAEETRAKLGISGMGAEWLSGGNDAELRSLVERQVSSYLGESFDTGKRITPLGVGEYVHTAANVSPLSLAGGEDFSDEQPVF